MNSDRIGGRRFWVVLLVYGGSSALLWFGKLDSEAYAGILQWSVAAYIAGNIGQRHIEAKSGDKA